MNELLGIIDVLEATILEGKKIPMTHRILIDESKVMAMLDKVRLVLQSEGNLIRESVDKSLERETSYSLHEVQSDISQAKKIIKDSERIRQGAEEYAEYVLANLQLLTSKMQADLLKLTQNIENGRQLLVKAQQDKIEFAFKK